MSDFDHAALRSFIASYDRLPGKQARLLQAVVELSPEGKLEVPVDQLREALAVSRGAPLEPGTFRQQLKRLNDSLRDDEAPFELVTEDGRIIARPTEAWLDHARDDVLESALRARSEDAARIDVEGMVSPRAMPRALSVMFSYAWLLPEAQQQIQIEFHDRLQEALHRPPPEFRRLPRIDLWRDEDEINPALRPGTAQTDQACRDAFLGLLMLSTKYEFSEKCMREAGFFLDEEGREQSGKYCLVMRFNCAASAISDRFKYQDRIIQSGADGNHLLGFWEAATEGERQDFVSRIAGFIFKAANAYLGAPPPPAAKHVAAGRKGTEAYLASRASRLPHDEESTVTSLARLGSFGEAYVDTAAAAPESGGVAIVDHLVRWATSTRPDRPRLAALLGDFGMGKTVTCQLVTKRLLREPGGEGRPPLPIYFDLRDLEPPKSPDMISLESLIDQLLRQPGETPPSARELIAFARERGALIIFDGLDEITNKLPADAARRLYRELLSIVPTEIWAQDAARRRQESGVSQSVRTGPSLLISCRSQYFSSIAAERGFLTDSDRSGLNPQKDIATYVMLPFKPDQVRSYIEKNLDPDQARRALTLIEETYNLGELAARPILLRYISEIVDRLEQQKLEGRSINITLLYDVLVEQTLERDNPKHSLPIHVKKQILEALALHLHKRSENSIGHATLEEWLRAEIERSHRHIAQSMVGADGLKLAEVFAQDLRNASLLSRPQDAAFQFGHASIREYFLGNALYHAVLAGLGSEPWYGPEISDTTREFILRRLDVDSPAGQVGFRREFQKLLEEGQPKESRIHAFQLWLKSLQMGAPLSAPERIDCSDFGFRTGAIGSAARRTPLRRARWDNSILTQLEFHNVDLRDSNFDGAMLRNVTFVKCRFEGASFKGAVLLGCQFRETSLGAEGLEGAVVDLIAAYDSKMGEQPWRPQGEVPVEATNWQIDMRTHSGFSLSVSAGIVAERPIVVTGGHDSSVRVWDARTGAAIASYRAPSGADLRVCVIEGDPPRIAVGSAAGLEIRDAETGALVASRPIAGTWVRSLAVGGLDGWPVIFAGSLVGTVHAIDPSTGEEIMTAAISDERIGAIAFQDSDGDALLVAGDGEGRVRFLGPGTGEVEGVIEPEIGEIRGLSFGYIEGRSVLAMAGSDGDVAIYDSASRTCMRKWHAHEGTVWAVKIFEREGDAVLISAGEDRIRFWNVESGEEVEIGEPVLSSYDAVDVIEIVGKPVIVEGQFDGTVRIRDAVRNVDYATIPGHKWETHALTGVLHEGCPRIARASDFPGIELIDPMSGEAVSRFGVNHGIMRSLSGHEDDDGYVVAASSLDGIAHFWRSGQSEPFGTISRDGRKIAAVCLTRIAGQIVCLTGSEDGQVVAWDIESLEPIRVFAEAGTAVSKVMVAGGPDRQWVATLGYGETVSIWSLEGGPVLHELGKASISLSAGEMDGRPVLATVSRGDRSVAIWDVEGGSLVKTFSGASTWLREVLLASHDGRTLVIAAGDGGLIFIWDGESGKLLRTLAAHQSTIQTLHATVADGDMVIGCGGCDIGLRLFRVRGRLDEPVECTFSMPGRPSSFRIMQDESGDRLIDWQPEAWRYWQARYDHAGGTFIAMLEDMPRARPSPKR